MFPTHTGWDALLHKTISALNFASENLIFDYIIRTGPTNLWSPRVTRQRLKVEIKTKSLYGALREFNGIKYIEGSNLILDKGSVEKLVSANSIFNYNLIDDLAIGQISSKLRLTLID